MAVASNVSPGRVRAGVVIEGAVPWPSELADAYRRAGYWQGTSLGELVREWAVRWSGRTAVVDGSRRLSYHELDRLADRRAAGLATRGITARDRVVVQLPNVAEAVVLLVALLRLGALPVLALPAHRRNEIVHVASLTEAVAYVVPDRHGGFDHLVLAREVVAAVPSIREVYVHGDAAEFVPIDRIDGAPRELPDPAADDVALFLLSGGTTGVPKLIPRTHDDYAYNARASAQVCRFDERTVYLAALPVAHNFPLACPGVLGTLGTGGRVVLCPDPDPETAFALIAREGVIATALVPQLTRLWLDAAEFEPADLSTLSLVQVGGSRLDPATAARIRPELGAQLQQVFGMAEGLLNYTRLDDPAELVETTQGRPLCPDDELRIVDEHGHDVAAGERGQLLTRGPYTLRGYYRAPEHNARAFTADGFFATGDLVRRLPTGHLQVLGRATEMINRGGEKVSAEEVQDHIGTHPAVRAVAVVAVAHPTLGERTCAVVVGRDTETPTLETIRAHLSARGLAAFKLPDQLVLVDRLPLTAVGKIDKTRLATIVAAELPGLAVVGASTDDSSRRTT
jgi:2,3-dihydroxybenzoate-AMP ligase